MIAIFVQLLTFSYIYKDYWVFGIFIVVWKNSYVIIAPVFDWVGICAQFYESYNISID